ncbi:MAG: hypothetical protein V3U76_15080 [Granulosicoccus sp.]
MTKTAVVLAMTALLGACGGDPADPGAQATDPAAAGELLDNAGETAVDAAGNAVSEAVPVVDAAADAVAGGGDGWILLQDNWEESVASIQAQWGELSSEDLMAVGGDREALVMLLQDRYSLDRDQAEQQLTDFEGTL